MAQTWYGLVLVMTAVLPGIRASFSPYPITTNRSVRRDPPISRNKLPATRAGSKPKAPAYLLSVPGRSKSPDSLA